MDFEIPEAGSQEFVDLLCMLDRARYENARAWLVVTIDDESGEIVHGHGPFEQAEQALTAAGEMDAEWQRIAEDEDDSTYTYKIVPLWGPGE